MSWRIFGRYWRSSRRMSSVSTNRMFGRPVAVAGGFERCELPDVHAPATSSAVTTIAILVRRSKERRLGNGNALLGCSGLGGGRREIRWRLDADAGHDAVEPLR